MEAQLGTFDRLPEGCVSTILSLTTPLDACRSSSISNAFRSASESDVVWERFLPPDYQEIVSSTIMPLKFSSKKELFHCLCQPILIDGGTKSFKLEKFSGRKSYILSARDLLITWSHDPIYWSWISLPDSRFSEVAILRTMCWLEIQGKISKRMLSSNTKYGAYLIIKILDCAYGLDLMPSETSIEVGNQIYSNTAYLRRERDVNCSKQQLLESLWYTNRMEMLKSRVAQGDGRVPSKRGDGWMEIELGEFFIDGQSDDEVKMSFMEVKGQHLKGGLVIEGIEVRPKH